MAYIPVDDKPTLNLNMDSFDATTPVHFDQMNPRHKQHLNNEKALLEQVKLKADISSPTFAGVPKAPTATTTDNSTQIATTAFVKLQGYVAADEGVLFNTSTIDGGYFVDGTDDYEVAIHNTSVTAHQSMSVDGGAMSVQVGSITLDEHLVDESAHSNIILDGNI